MSSTGGHLYSTAASAYTGFFDIISGSNGTYFCNPSFDKVTGLGSRPCHGHREINHGAFLHRYSERGYLTGLVLNMLIPAICSRALLVM